MCYVNNNGRIYIFGRHYAHNPDLVGHHIQWHVLVVHGRCFQTRVGTQADGADLGKCQPLWEAVPLLGSLEMSWMNESLEAASVDKMAVDLVHVECFGSMFVHEVAEFARPVGFLLAFVEFYYTSIPDPDACRLYDSCA